MLEVKAIPINASNYVQWPFLRADMDKEAVSLPRAVSKSVIALEKSRWFANAAPRATYASTFPLSSSRARSYVCSAVSWSPLCRHAELLLYWYSVCQRSNSTALVLCHGS